MNLLSEKGFSSQVKDLFKIFGWRQLKANSEGIIRFKSVCEDVAMYYLQDRAWLHLPAL